MEFRVARAARITGEMLERLVHQQLADQNIPEPDCVICYGSGYSGNLPSLNAACTRLNKLEQVRRVHQAIPDASLSAGLLTEGGIILPVVARKIRHSKGKDIIVCRTQRDIQRAIRRGRQYYTPLVESQTEYRVWVYRNRILAVYEKRLTEPELNTKFGRNRQNGWTFHALESAAIPDNVRHAARDSVAALGLDFGAVDVLGTVRGGNGVVGGSGVVAATVLEVNSAPGISDEHRTAIVKLVHRIVRWCANGCPARTEG